MDKVKAKAERFKDPVIGCLGLTFKANIDDLRESPSLEIVRQLRDMKLGTILACDPNVEPSKAPFPLHELKDVIRQSDILLLLVDHAEFLEVDPQLTKDKVVIDTRGAWK